MLFWEFFISLFMKDPSYCIVSWINDSVSTIKERINHFLATGQRLCAFDWTILDNNQRIERADRQKEGIC
jgi:hypothetical protein